MVMAITLTIGFSSYGSTGEKKVSLRGHWKFALGDNAIFSDPHYNDSDWEEIYVPSSWQNEGFKDYNGYAWYRTRVDISFDRKEILYLELGRIDDADEVYVNGHLIGSSGGFPPNYFTAWDIPRTYLIPGEYLNASKENVIAIRVYDEGGEGGILGKNIGVYSYDTYTENGFGLFGNWKFHLLDDMEWSKENFDDSNWENIIAPSTWERQGFRDFDGMAWYRKRFTLPARFKTTDLVLLLGKIDDMDEVFINGEMVGHTGNMEGKWIRGDEWQKPRTYFIPDNLVRAGAENVIAVRVYDKEGNGGIFEGPLTIIPRTEYKQFWKKYHDSNAFSWWSLLDW